MYIYNVRYRTYDIIKVLLFCVVAVIVSYIMFNSRREAVCANVLEALVVVNEASAVVSHKYLVHS